MLTMARNPSLKWLKVSNKKIIGGDKQTVWGGLGRDEIVMHRSWNSIRLIIEWMKTNLKREEVVLYVPEYYCYDTIFQIADAVKLVYYPIKDSLVPDMAECRRLAKQIKPDLFIFAHYWGHIFDGNDAAVFCRQYDAVLIEDAAHVLIPDKRIGKQSDFILFSPWKLLGLPDGAILVVGNKNRYQFNKIKWKELLADLIKEEKTVVSQINIFRWKLKRVLIKVLPNIRVKPFESSGNCKKEAICEVSFYSKRILNQITEEELRELGERRKENNLYLAEYCKRKWNVSFLFDGNIEVPYMAAVCISDTVQRREFLEQFRHVGKIVSKWPLLPPDIPEQSNARKLERDVLAIAVHDNLSLNILARRLKDTYTDNRCNLVLRKVDREQYDSFCDKIAGVLPLLQSSVYGEVKANAQGWRPEYYLIYEDAVCVACFMALRKKKILTVFRINQGIVWLKEDCRDIQQAAYALVVRKFSGHGKILFLASREKRAGDSLALLIRSGLCYRKTYAGTGYLKLCKTEDELRKCLHSKWRNQLKAAESTDVAVCISTEPKELSQFLELHVQHKKEAHYEDSGDVITNGLIKSQALKAYFVKDECAQVLAFVMFALHGKNATYYIGWNSEEGCRLNLNKLLLWNAVLDLKKRGYQWMDLGGIDFIHTPGIAEFKMGTGCVYYEMAGEFISLHI